MVNFSSSTYTGVAVPGVADKQGLAELALRPHRVVLAVEANVQLVDSRALGMLVALARGVAALAHVGEVAAKTDDHRCLTNPELGIDGVNEAGLNIQLVAIDSVATKQYRRSH